MSDVGADVGLPIGGKIITEVSNYINVVLAKVEEGELAYKAFRENILTEQRRSISRIEDYISSHTSIEAALHSNSDALKSVVEKLSANTAAQASMEKRLDACVASQEVVVQHVSSLSIQVADEKTAHSVAKQTAHSLSNTSARPLAPIVVVEADPSQPCSPVDLFVPQGVNETTPMTTAGGIPLRDTARELWDSIAEDERQEARERPVCKTVPLRSPFSVCNCETLLTALPFVHFAAIWGGRPLRRRIVPRAVNVGRFASAVPANDHVVRAPYHRGAAHQPFYVIRSICRHLF
ncbi:MAG: hypothetical protein GY822_27010 [Deltaproteobacteria bacterium]|nr:hypothetical protein [Deltaproteobacteria bacterium]